MKKFVFLAATLLVCCTLLMTASTLMAATGPQMNAQQGVRQGDGPGGDVNMRDLPDLSPADRAVVRQIPSHRTPGMSEAQYQAAKSAASHSGMGPRPQDAARLQAPKNPNTDIASETPSAFIDFLAQSEGCAGTGWVPSDMGLAVNATYIVQVVNECIGVYTKATGALVVSKDLCGIFGLPQSAGTTGCFDPRVLYDAQAAKFLVTASYSDVNGNGWLLTAATGNPTGARK